MPVDEAVFETVPFMKGQNIILTGMPGAGKSTIGVLLAKSLGMSFLDTDLIIQQKEGRLLQKIIDTQGVAGFIAIEATVIQQINANHCVIATGGSAIYVAEAVSHLRSLGKMYYLQLPFVEIERRVHNMASRGIAIEKNQRLIDLYQERIPLYERYADVIIDCAGLSVEETVQKIVILIKTAGMA
jgi:shikimate kinase